MTIRRIATASLPRYRVKLVEYVRLRSLARLYARRDAVDDLIRSLQNYVEVSKASRSNCIPITAGRKYS
jgi:hypothetical protein